MLLSGAYMLMYPENRSLWFHEGVLFLNKIKP